jgi:sugar phosphate isomerase/epimerase
MINLAFSTNAFKRYSLEDSIREIAKVGYRGVEILCDIPHAYAPTFKDDQVRSLKKTLTSSNMQISNLNAFTLYAVGDTYHPSWIEDSREIRIEHTIECIRLAKKVGAKHLSTEPGGPVPPPPPPAPPEAAPPQQFQDMRLLEKMFRDGVTRVAKIAEEMFITQLSNSRHVRLNFDIGHFYCVNEDPAKLVYELSDYIEHFHLADIADTRIHNHLIPGKGSIDFRRVFDAMDDISYRGFVTVELYPYQDNPVQAAEEAYSYLCSIT